MAREAKLHRRREDANRAGGGVVDEDRLAVSQVGRDRLAQFGVGYLPAVEKHAEGIAAAAVVAAEDPEGVQVEPRHGVQPTIPAYEKESAPGGCDGDAPG